MKRKAIAEKIWGDERYYKRITKIEDFSHPGYLKLQSYSKKAKSILDVGCGDGSKLERFGNKESQKNGVEISQAAIDRGQKCYPKINFHLFDGEKLPFPDLTFDLVTCMFVLEHTQKPNILLSEIIRVTKKGGNMGFLAPNFGAPNRASPNNSQPRIEKLIRGVMNDFLPNNSKLGWQEVEPKKLDFSNFDSDLDTTIEPYLLSLSRFLEANEAQTSEINSFWSQERIRANFIQKSCRILGELRIFPFRYWGPHLFVVAQKI